MENLQLVEHLSDRKRYWSNKSEDRFYACVIEDLHPPKESECENKLIKNFDKANSLRIR